MCRRVVGHPGAQPHLPITGPANVETLLSSSDLAVGVTSHPSPAYAVRAQHLPRGIAAHGLAPLVRPPRCPCLRGTASPPSRPDRNSQSSWRSCLSQPWPSAPAFRLAAAEPTWPWCCLQAAGHSPPATSHLWSLRSGRPVCPACPSRPHPQPPSSSRQDSVALLLLLPSPQAHLTCAVTTFLFSVPSAWHRAWHVAGTRRLVGLN